MILSRNVISFLNIVGFIPFLNINFIIQKQDHIQQSLVIFLTQA